MVLDSLGRSMLDQREVGEMSVFKFRSLSLVFCGVWLACGAIASAAERGAKASDAPVAAVEEVDLFEAIERDEITAKVIPKDATRVRLQLSNRTDRPLSVRVPAAIAAVPVLAQAGGFNFGAPAGVGFFGANGGQPGAGGAGGAGRNQALGIGGGNPLGGGIGPGAGAGILGGPGGGAGFRGGFFNVPAGKAIKIDLPAVCLEHAKRAPHHGIPYELLPIERWTSDPQVAGIVATLNDSTVDRELVQVAAWKVTSGWKWEEMDAMTVHRPWGAIERKFSPEVLRGAKKLTERLAAPQPQRSLTSR